MHICIFEDVEYRNLLPLAYTRPVYDLQLGIASLKEKIIAAFNRPLITLHCRSYLAAVTEKNNQKCQINKLPKAKTCLFINGRAVMDNGLLKKILTSKTDVLLVEKGAIIAAMLSQKNLALVDFNKEEIFADVRVKKINISATVIRYPWDLISHNAKQITQDANASGRLGHVEGTVYPGVYLINKRQIYIGAGAKVKPGSVLDAETGPIYIDQGAIIGPSCTIEGPVCIGSKAIINAGARIKGGTTIGESSKVGGEVAESIIHGYANKQHEGFLGHSYIGAWCNLGAGTNTSDLKNNYGTIEVLMNSTKINTGQQFVGLFMGDHSKAGINTMFNSGAVVGVGCNVFGAGYQPKYVPSFTWLDMARGPVTYELEKCLATAGIVQKRRKIQFTKADQQLITHLFSQTKPERNFKPK